MLRKFACLCCFVLAVTVTVGQSKADLLLKLTGLNGETFHEFLPGEEKTLLLSVETTRDVVLLNGGDAMLHVHPLSGNPIADAPDYSNIVYRNDTWQEAVYLPDGAGAWTAVPPEGGPRRFFTGGPAAVQILFNTGDTFDFGTIVFRAGSAAPGQIFETVMTEVEMLDGSFLPLDVTIQNFSYSVVPEPSSMMLLGTALCGLVVRRRRNA